MIKKVYTCCSIFSHTLLPLSSVSCTSLGTNTNHC